jgi:hypothetical protein
MTRVLGRSLVVGLVSAAIVAAPGAGAEPTANGYNGAPTPVSGGPVPVVNGVPCVGGNFGVCVGFAQNQPPRIRPGSQVGHSPTVGS